MISRPYSVGIVCVGKVLGTNLRVKWEHVLEKRKRRKMSRLEVHRANKCEFVRGRPTICLLLLLLVEIETPGHQERQERASIEKIKLPGRFRSSLIVIPEFLIRKVI